METYKKQGKTAVDEPDLFGARRPYGAQFDPYPSPSRVSGLWNTRDLLSDRILCMLEGKDGSLDGWSARFDKDNGRILLNRSMQESSVNIWLEPGSGIINGITYYEAETRSEFAGTVLELEKSGIFNFGAAKELGFSVLELLAGGEVESRVRQLEKLDVSDINSLKDFQEYSGSSPLFVPQKEAKIAGSDKKVGLYTFGADPCAILIAMSRDTDNKTRNIGMAHIDSASETEQITRFLSLVKRDDKLEAYVIGGGKSKALKIIESCAKAKAEIKFFSTNKHRKIADSAIVSPEGEIYYGHKKHSFMKGDEPETDSVPFDLDAGLSIRFVV